MSDSVSNPVSNIEIEDVLSSIRRLVSEETGAQPRPDPVRQPPQENRLVLTPALRVTADDVDTSKAEPEMVEPEIAEVEAVEAETDTPWSNPDTTLYTAAQIEPDTDSEPKDIEDAVLLAADDAEPSEDADTDVEAIYENKPSDVFVMTEEIRQDDPMPEVEEAPADEASTLDNLSLSDDQDEFEDELPKDVGFDDLTPLSAKIEALEAAIGETQDQWESDGMAGDDYAGTPVRTLEWQDHIEDEAVEEDVASVEPPEDVEPPASATIIPPVQPAFVQDSDDGDEDEDTNELDFLVGDDNVMDEESLRELVADIVREELQGALGERITRNVRKLVRREIHRALTSQQLD